MISSFIKRLGSLSLTLLLALYGCDNRGSPVTLERNKYFPLSVFLLTPENNASDVSNNPLVQLQFNMPMDPSTVSNRTVSLLANGKPVPLTSMTNGPNNQFTFAVAAPLSGSTSYQIIVSRNVRALTGATLLNEQTFNFTTSPSSSAPNVVMISPSNQSVGVETRPDIILQFSEAMNLTTLNQASIQLVTNGLIVPISPIKIFSNHQMAFTPVKPLNKATTYKVVLHEDITDKAGNPLAATSFIFVTKS